MERLESIDRFQGKALKTLLQREKLALASYGYKDLSIREYHVIEAACSAVEPPTMGVLAQMLGVTVGSATVAVKTLEKKGYLLRHRSPMDARRVEVLPTEMGRQVDAHHRQYHRRMLEAIQQALDPSQLDALAQAMRVITELFGGRAEQRPGSCGQF